MPAMTTTTRNAFALTVSSVKVGTVYLEGSTLVRTTSPARRVAGGSVVDVERVEDSTAANMIFADGTVHPAGRAGFRWTACLCNLRSVS